jgi:cell division protein FtsQ
VPKIFFLMLLLIGGVGTYSDDIKAGIVRSFPVRYVRVTGTFQYLDKGDVKKVIGHALQDSFLTVDILAIREAVESLPWVDTVSVARVWPDIVDIHVAEQSAVALWGREELLNDRGELFKPVMVSAIKDLPILMGPVGAHKRVFDLLGKLQINVDGAGLDLATLMISPQYAVSAVFSNGMKIQLGRDKPIERLRRFMGVYDRINKNENGAMKQVDMRYHNGFSVAWR